MVWKLLNKRIKGDKTFNNVLAARLAQFDELTGQLQMVRSSSLLG